MTREPFSASVLEGELLGCARGGQLGYSGYAAAARQAASEKARIGRFLAISWRTDGALHTSDQILVNRATTGPVRRVLDFTFGRMTGFQRPVSESASHSGVRCRFSSAMKYSAL